MRLSCWQKIILLSLLLASLSLQSYAQPLETDRPRPSSTAIMVDVPVRVLGLGLTVISGALFVVSYPFAYASNSVSDTWDALVREPLQFTFVRPMGQFEDWDSRRVRPTDPQSTDNP